MLRVHQHVRGLGRELPVGPVMASGNHDEGLDAATVVVLRAVQAVQGVQEHVDALVTVFVAAADGDEKGVGGDRLRAHGRGHLHQALARRIVQTLVFGVGGRGKAVFKPVGRHHIHRPAQELGAFAGGNVAHGSEHIGLLGAGFFQGIDGRHVEAAGHFVSVVGA